jgi:hypothetical protein
VDKPEKPARRLRSMLWAAAGALVGFALAAVGTWVEVYQPANSRQAGVRTRTFGVTVHNRDVAPEAMVKETAMEKEVQTWGYGLPILFTFTGGGLAYATAAGINRRLGSSTLS